MRHVHKYEKQSHMRGVDVAKLHNMMKRGYSPREISEITGRSLSSINNYFIVIEDVMAGKPIRISPDRYSVRVVKEWCEAIGKEFIPYQAEEKPVQLKIQPDRSLADEAEALATLLHEFAERIRAFE